MTTRDDVRLALAAKNITPANVTIKQLSGLHGLLCTEIYSSGCFGGTYRIDPHNIWCLDKAKLLTCSASYFSAREAVTFNYDGFIGIAGWASEENVKPILKALIKWANSWPSPKPLGGAL